jgi:uncharacterized membrane protein YhaH (DUF805 family)
MKWYFKVLNNYVNFRGRARRKEYWMFVLVNLIPTLILYLPGMVLLYSRNSREMAMVFLLLFILYELAVLVPSIAVVVRRLHDQNKSGAWYLLYFAAAFIRILIGGLLTSLIALGFSIWFLVLMCLDGTHGPNQYGEDPKAPEGEEHHTEKSEGFGYMLDAATVTGISLDKTIASVSESIYVQVFYQNNTGEAKDTSLTLYANDFAVQNERIVIPPVSTGTAYMLIPPILKTGDYVIRVGSCTKTLQIQ